MLALPSHPFCDLPVKTNTFVSHVTQVSNTITWQHGGTEVHKNSDFQKNQFFGIDS